MDGDGQRNDACGNSSSADQIIIVDDTTPPVLTIPADITMECGESTAPVHTGQAGATDNCSVQLSFSDTVSTGACSQGSLIIRSWTAVDPCGNLVSEDQMILIQAPASPVVYLAPIVRMEQVSTNLVVWSLTTNTWAVQPEYCTDLTDGPEGWMQIPGYSNLLQVGANVTTLLGQPPPNHPHRFFRIRQIPP